MKLVNALVLLSTTASSLMITAYADDEVATPALRAAAGSTESVAASSVASSSFLEQAEDIKTKLVVKKKKTKKIEGEGSGSADPYANSLFEGICKDIAEEDGVNWMFCERLCSMCENEGECCISKHLGCHSNPTLSHLYEGFLAGPGSDQPPCATPKYCD